ncbi:MAG: pyridoxal 5-phosphate synthase pdxT subunit [Methanothermococcus sp.]|jgi:5'-phosphate synthase pdxT subunit|uniref:pyridoxal 5'-phosphate synthase glutaminase subunit PdxT n=1 Tax=Methanothermococcus TaxID=155862 RepID=UPI00037F0853|nr:MULTISPECIES: pyridoxal 5'-phosphate synthase glutaminase subunit PdxT [Methanothermococcus]MDK2790335.1 pyridoxal 5-phosphate synthase pdxT subunit [Methanothermococcus sp.]MDK2987698.1 pyridoxal 5-phosphate synthase pdxT subunit [Methanothermococcus sp.]
MKIIGVLGIQGDIEEHEDAIKKIDCIPKRVRTVEDLKDIDALVIPGGESTTMGKLMEKYGFIGALRNSNIPILGTCAGMVLLSKGTGREQPLLKLMNITIKRNAYGSQRESFEKEIELNDCGEKVHAVFIRAPLVDEILSDDVKIIAKDDENIVGVKEGKYMAIAFHPELSEDGYKVYKYFLEEIVKK